MAISTQPDLTENHLKYENKHKLHRSKANSERTLVTTTRKCSLDFFLVPCIYGPSTFSKKQEYKQKTKNA